MKQVVSGYSGGHLPQPTYEQVCSGGTGHAEVVQLTFDPAVVSFADLLRVFFSVHDPTTLNSQGPDVGTQYRSAIFYHTPEQEAAAKAVIEELTERAVWPDPVVTDVTPITTFYPAEEHHQQYYRRNSSSAYCQVLIAPKVAKLRKERLAALKS